MVVQVTALKGRASIHHGGAASALPQTVLHAAEVIVAFLRRNADAHFPHSDIRTAVHHAVAQILQLALFRIGDFRAAVLLGDRFLHGGRGDPVAGGVSIGAHWLYRHVIAPGRRLLLLRNRSRLRGGNVFLLQAVFLRFPLLDPVVPVGRLLSRSCCFRPCASSRHGRLFLRLRLLVGIFVFLGIFDAGRLFRLFLVFFKRRIPGAPFVGIVLRLFRVRLLRSDSEASLPVRPVLILRFRDGVLSACFLLEHSLRGLSSASLIFLQQGLPFLGQLLFTVIKISRLAPDGELRNRDLIGQKAFRLRALRNLAGIQRPGVIVPPGLQLTEQKNAVFSWLQYLHGLLPQSGRIIIRPLPKMVPVVISDFDNLFVFVLRQNVIPAGGVRFTDFHLPEALQLFPFQGLSPLHQIGVPVGNAVSLLHHFILLAFAARGKVGPPHVVKSVVI